MFIKYRKIKECNSFWTWLCYSYNFVNRFNYPEEGFILFGFNFGNWDYTKEIQ